MDTSDIYHRHHQRLMLNIAAILASLFMAAGAFSLLEDWTFTKGLYFAVQTATVRVNSPPSIYIFIADDVPAADCTVFVIIYLIFLK